MERKTNPRSHSLENKACQQAQSQLEEALVNDASSKEDFNAPLQHHLADCPDCADFVKLTHGLKELAPTETEEERLSSALAARDAYFKGRRRRKNSAVAWVAVAAAAVFLIVLYSTFHQTSVNEKGAGELLATSKRLQLLNGRATLFLTDNGIARTVMLKKQAMHVSLETGLLCVNIKPNPNRHVDFRVITPAGTVDVKGTAFAVEVTDLDVRVDVVRGEVLTTTKQNEKDSSVAVGAGQSIAFGNKNTVPISNRSQMRIINLLEIKESTTLHDKSPAVSKDKNDSPKDIVNDTLLQKPANRDKAPSQRSSLKALLDTARKCRGNKSWQCAVENYAKIVKRFPNRPESVTSRVIMGQIQLRHLGQPGKARQNFQRSLEQSPSGPLAEEALHGLASAAKQLGNPSLEKKTLERFLTRHPSSPLAGAARQRLEALR